MLALQPTMGFSLLGDFFSIPSFPYSIFSTLLFPSSGYLPQRLQSIFSLVFLWFSYPLASILIFLYALSLHPSASRVLVRPITEFFGTFWFLQGRVVSPAPNPQPGGPGYPFLSGSSPLTCLAWEALLVAYATASIAVHIVANLKVTWN